MHALSRGWLVCLAVFAIVAGDMEAGEPTPPSKADEALETFALGDIIVTATRRDSTLFDVPYSADAYNADYILFRKMPRTVPEILAEDPSVMVQKTGHGQGSPYIRGFTGFRTLFLIDGIRLNNSTFRDGPNQYWNTVDGLTIDRLEVVRGPSSVLYGSDAVGGTVNAITRGREEFPEGFNWSRRLYTRVSSAEDSVIGRMEVSGNVDEHLGLMLGTTLKDFGDLEGGKSVGTYDKTGYDERDCDIKLQYRFDENHRLVFAHQRVRLDDAWRIHKTIYGIGWHGTTVGSELERSLDQERDLTYLQYIAEDLDGPVQSIKLSLSYQVQAEERYRLRTRDRIDRQGVTCRTLGLGAQFTSDTPIGLLTYGAEYYRDNVDSWKHTYNLDGSVASTAIQGPVADDATYDLLGVYIQDEFAITDRLDAILGVRYTYAKADADKVQDPATGNRMDLEDSWGNLSGSARLIYHLSEHWNLFGGVSQGFRAPNLSDLTRLDSARTGEIETPSPGLDPEKFIAGELGIKVHHPRWGAQIAYFYTDIRDMIVRYPTGAVIDDDNEVQKANVGDGYIHGIEARADHKLAHTVTVFAAMAWVWGEVDTYPTADQVEAREPIDRLPPITGLVGARWQHPSRRVWVEGVVRIANDQDHLSTRDKADTQRIPPSGTPGYGVCDLRAGVRVTDDLTLTAACENILDKDYRIHGSGLNEPGRNFILSADWRF